MRFVKLRLTGFKSFVEPTELALEQGITAIVGPNGCGKSNLVEALRWVMGESSARRLRGADMDDVIFGGTASRPRRNIAEVSLTLDNTGRTAPAAFNAEDELQVVRRIERDKGSDFRINGRSVRARDVQMLFQDNGAGASSAALVSQGRVGALIAARPGERRQILEEAAGIAGLHARRQEAESRLKAAEDNLTRTQDVLLDARSRIDGLRRQARQAEKYRTLSDAISDADRQLIRRRWAAATRALTDARYGHQVNERATGDAMIALERATAAEATAQQAVAPLRARDAACLAAIQKMMVAIDRLDREAEKVSDRRRDTGRQRDQIDRDAARERDLMAEADRALAALDREKTDLQTALAALPRERDKAATAAAEAAATLQSIENTVSDLTARAAAADETLAGARRRLSEREHDARRLSEKLAIADRALAEAAARAGTLPDVRMLIDQAGAAELAATAARRSADDAEQAAREAEEALKRSEKAASDAAGPVQKLESEAAGLQAILQRSGPRRQLGQQPDAKIPTAFDQLLVDPGSEAAATAALGDGMRAAINNEDAARYWRDGLSDAGDFRQAGPPGCRPLAASVKGPGVIRRRLQATWVADTLSDALEAQAFLKPGERIATLEGSLVEWDGLVSQADAPSPEAALLRHRNRLDAIAVELADARRAAHMASEHLARTRSNASTARDFERQTRQDVDRTYSHARRLRDDATRAEREAERAADRHQAAERAVGEARAALDEAERRVEEAEADIASLQDPETIRAALADGRARRDRARAADQQHRAAVETLDRQGAGKRRRLSAAASEAMDWSRRRQSAAERVADVDRRLEECRTILEDLAGRPEAIAAEREDAANALDQARRDQHLASQAVAKGEDDARTAMAALRDADLRLATLKETRARLESEVRHAQDMRASIREQAEEKIGVLPETLEPEAGRPEVLGPKALEPETSNGEQETVTSLTEKTERLRRQRDALGPVNLRAEQDLREALESIDRMEADRADIAAAVERLRQGIATLNKDARTRLTEAFKLVNGHFQTLFTQLFGGGAASLRLTDMDDPLSSGLEIFASPPGKKLQNLALLSGGEQALTALALLFSVFLTRPSPICVLDEVDAPLDDANVDRLCSLLEDLAERNISRFIAVTHHRLTMARANRLYGVTMQERGLSHLVSLDAGRAETLRQPRLNLV